MNTLRTLRIVMGKWGPQIKDQQSRCSINMPTTNYVKLATKRYQLRTRHNALLDGRLGGVERVGDAVLLLADLHLAAAADLDHRDAARQLRQPLLQLLPARSEQQQQWKLLRCD